MICFLFLQIYHRILNDEESESGVVSAKPRDVDARYAVMQDAASGRAFYQRMACLPLVALLMSAKVELTVNRACCLATTDRRCSDSALLRDKAHTVYDSLHGSRDVARSPSQDAVSGGRCGSDPGHCTRSDPALHLTWNHVSQPDVAGNSIQLTSGRTVHRNLKVW